MQTTSPKPYVFVLMPFDKAFDDIYKLGIKPACNNAGAYAERVDEQMYDGRILERVYNQIAKADVIVADMTGRNPNVFYEVGYAHALGKTLIPLTQKSEDIPFDLKDYPHIVYAGSISDLIPELEKRVRWAVEHRGQRIAQQKASVKLYNGGTEITEGFVLDYPVSARGNREVNLDFDIHNSDTAEIVNTQFELGFVVSKRFITVRKFEGGPHWAAINLPNGSSLFLYDEHISMLPGLWEKITIRMLCRGDKPVAVGQSENIAVRFFSDTGVRDFSLTLRFVEKKLVA